MADATELAFLQRIIDESAHTAGAAIRQNFIGGGWQMTAEEFVAFWENRPMASIATVSATGQVHVAPLDPVLVGADFQVPTFANSVRLLDHRTNPRCGITAWDGPYKAVIVYGNAIVTKAGDHDLQVAAGQSYDERGVVKVVVRPTRIYGIRPPPGHHAAKD